VDGDAGGPHPGDRVEQQPLVLHLAQAADDPDQRHVGRDAGEGTQASRHAAHRLDVDPERDHGDARRRRDPEAHDQVAALRGADRDDAIGDAREEPLDDDDRRGHPAAVVALEDVAVERVHDAARARASPQRGRHGPAVDRGGGAPQHACLRLVRVDDVGPETEQQLHQRPEHARVAESHRATHRRHDDRIEPGGAYQMAHVAFARRDRAAHEHGFELLGVEAARQPCHVPRRPADVQAIHDADHPDASPPLRPLHRGDV